MSFTVLNVEFLNQCFDKYRGSAVKLVKQIGFARRDISLCVVAVFCLWSCILFGFVKREWSYVGGGVQRVRGRREGYQILYWEQRGKKWF